MKASKFITVVVLVCITVNTFSQSESDLIIIDEIAENIEQLKSEFSAYPYVYIINEIAPNALEQTSLALANKQIEDLHIFVLTKPGAMIFNNIALTTDKLDELPGDLSRWSDFISGKVVIHSDIVFTGKEGILLKHRLESITGLEFIMQN